MTVNARLRISGSAVQPDAGFPKSNTRATDKIPAKAIAFGHSSQTWHRNTAKEQGILSISRKENRLAPDFDLKEYRGNWHDQSDARSARGIAREGQWNNERTMALFILRRLFHAIPILFGVSVVVFGLVHMVPGNPLDVLLPADAPKEVIDRLKAEYGFDKPLIQQYFAWLGRIMHGDLGTSVFTGQKVTGDLMSALANTFLLAVPAAVLGFAFGVVLGLLAGLNYGSWLDKLFSFIAIFGVSVPHFWLAIVLVVCFSVLMPLLPAAGMNGDGGFPTGWDDLKHFILPVLSLSLIPMGVISRLVRSTVLEVLAQEFTGALRAKGLRRGRIILHVIKNAAPPALALMGLQFGYLLGGSILVELVYNWPGAGQLMNLAIFRRDIPVLQATVLVLASFFVLINLLVDLLQAAIDPRMRR